MTLKSLSNKIKMLLTIKPHQTYFSRRFTKISPSITLLSQLLRIVDKLTQEYFDVHLTVLHHLHLTPALPPSWQLKELGTFETMRKLPQSEDGAAFSCRHLFPTCIFDHGAVGIISI